ncbi:nitrous oxide-stimulated promoter family protein [Thiorhodovibrio frisius]|uniref:nitrous oxide-stimulated promoter family protein n=1 Tax=Thiorhodovibrio frisius TaxID=631362 RepID=UPI0002F33B5F|nr:nitrous oxide-stimulated promoter family protein [Thiorhodovibrio frisius]
MDNQKDRHQSNGRQPGGDQPDSSRSYSAKAARPGKGRRQPRNQGPRIGREKRTIKAMTALYCRDHHQGAKPADGLCAECADLFDYAQTRLDYCPFGESKYACADCQIGCYTEEMATATRNLMRYAGPRLWRRHPILALFHFLDGHLLHRAPDRSAAAARPGRDKNASQGRKA